MQLVKLTTDTLPHAHAVQLTRLAGLNLTPIVSLQGECNGREGGGVTGTPVLLDSLSRLARFTLRAREMLRSSRAS